jgi:hypothetical protein
MFLEIVGNGKDRMYKHICNYCKIEYHSKYKDGKYCTDCMDKKTFLLNKKRPDYIGKKITEAKLKFFQTERGKEVATLVGKKNSENTKNFYKTESGKKIRKAASVKQSITMKNKISKGEFTPPITNSFTHWDAVLYLEDNTTKRFRSSWEACVWLSNSHLKYESSECRTKIQSDGKVYVADFFDEKNKILYEIKPKSFFLKQSKKIDAIIEHAKLNGYKFVWINEYNILEYIKPELFSEQNIPQLNKVIKVTNATN